MLDQVYRLYFGAPTVSRRFMLLSRYAASRSASLPSRYNANKSASLLSRYTASRVCFQCQQKCKPAFKLQSIKIAACLHDKLPAKVQVCLHVTMPAKVQICFQLTMPAKVQVRLSRQKPMLITLRSVTKTGKLCHGLQHRSNSHLSQSPSQV